MASIIKFYLNRFTDLFMFNSTLTDQSTQASAAKASRRHASKAENNTLNPRLGETHGLRLR